MKIAIEIQENIEAVKTNLSKIELLNESLVNKLILVNRVSKHKDMEKAVDHLSRALETHSKKWMTAKTGNTETLRKVDRILQAVKKRVVTWTLEPFMGMEYIRFKHACDLKLAFLEREVKQFSDQVYWYICSGLKNNHSKEGCNVHLINNTWLQALESKGVRNMDLYGLVKLNKVEAFLRMPKHQRRMGLLKIRKTGSHGNFLKLLEIMVLVTEWEAMTAEEMLIHLFSEQSYAIMQKHHVEILVSPTPTVAALRSMVAEIENSFWY